MGDGWGGTGCDVLRRVGLKCVCVVGGWGGWGYIHVGGVLVEMIPVDINDSNHINNFWVNFFPC